MYLHGELQLGMKSRHYVGHLKVGAILETKGTDVLKTNGVDASEMVD